VPWGFGDAVVVEVKVTMAAVSKIMKRILVVGLRSQTGKKGMLFKGLTSAAKPWSETRIKPLF
jgi:hypothetical protein